MAGENWISVLIKKINGKEMQNFPVRSLTYFAGFIFGAFNFNLFIGLLHNIDKILLISTQINLVRCQGTTVKHPMSIELAILVMTCAYNYSTIGVLIASMGTYF